ncbi:MULTISPECIES: hypothetical protein [Streptomyces]|nr:MULTISPECIES: hypothetical protein [Streptomyces]
MEETMVPRRGLRIDLVPRGLPFALIGVAVAVLSECIGLSLWGVGPVALLIAVEMRIRRI